MSDYLFELGTEELPATRIDYIRNQFASIWQQLLSENRIDFDNVITYATPRRIALLTYGIARMQRSDNHLRTGPWQEQAFDVDGRPTPAAIGFARSCQVEVDQLDLIEEKGRKRLACRIKQQGMPVTTLLPTLVTTMIDRVHLPQSMRWGNARQPFIRPVRWLCSLLDQEHVPITAFALNSTNQTRGHRFLHPQTREISKASDYCQTLEQAHVIVDQQRRKQQIVDQIDAIAKQHNATACYSQELLDELTYLVELSEPVFCYFDESFLQLPDQVLILTMVKHQRYIYLKQRGAIQPTFIAVSNIPDKTGVIAKGNERVLRPRLSDAMFFLEQDLRVGIDAMAARLDKVTFEAALGNMASRSQRMEQLTVALSSYVHGNDIDEARAASKLAKADLVSHMVDEFPELQGYIGGHYAFKAGYPRAVSQAIAEQYLPTMAGGALPQTTLGKLLALADRLDLLTGFFIIGKKPTSEKDPYSLRRAAMATVRIAISIKDLPDLSTVLNLAASHYQYEKIPEDLTLFIHERMRSFYLDQGTPPQVFAAVTAAACKNMYDLDRRIAIVQTIYDNNVLGSLSQLSKRIANILGSSSQTQVNTALFVEAAERRLYETSKQLEVELATAYKAGKYEQYLEKLGKLVQPVDNFFLEVMVNCEDQRLKQNRLSLLSQVHEQCTRIVDITLLG